eukprot:1162143-Pelagomonas_calceolata.AAC.36
MRGQCFWVTTLPLSPSSAHSLSYSRPVGPRGHHSTYQQASKQAYNRQHEANSIRHTMSGMR